ncbi:MAG TPA: hypothetical protein VGG83_06755 [Trebonia sp.]|jgi:hypothetical protein
MTDDVFVVHGERTWRPSVWFRVRLSLFLAVAALTLAGTVGVPGWWVLVGAAPLWAWLVPRAWAVSATLTYDSLVIRNPLTTRRVAVEDIVEVTFYGWNRRDELTLKVTDRAAVKRRRVSAVRIDAAGKYGRRCAGDDAADAIRAAAGLPPVPPGWRALYRCGDGGNPVPSVTAGALPPTARSGVQ